ANPVISIQISGVDVDPIIAAAKAQDNAGNRRRAIREMLFETLAMQETNDFFTTYVLPWRGSRREVEVVYDNVREMSDERLRGRGGDTWTVAIDIPFDDSPHTPNDDRARLQRFEGVANTLAWLPSFLSDKAQADLGRMVVLDYLMRGENFEKCATHLSSVDRAQAKALLSNQLTVLKQRLRDCLRVAYGIDTQPRDAVQAPLDADSHFESLDHT